jgi:hypothetical protein
VHLDGFYTFSNRHVEVYVKEVAEEAAAKARRW